MNMTRYSYYFVKFVSVQPRLRCLVKVVDSLKSDPNGFLLTILPEVLLGLKETNERTRVMSSQLIVKMGFATMKCSDRPSEGIPFNTSQLNTKSHSLSLSSSPRIVCADSITRFLSSVLAGLAGSPHLVSATIVALTRLVHEFHGEWDIVELMFLHMQTLEHKHICTHVYVPTHTPLYTFTHTPMHTHIHPCTHSHTPMYTLTHTPMYTLTHTPMYVHTHIQL